MTKPTYMIVHGSAAVQAARIIAANAKVREERARGYELAAQWHDAEAERIQVKIHSGDVEMWKSIMLIQSRLHHMDSATGLRNAASELIRPATTE